MDRPLGAHGPAGPAVAAIADEFEDFAVAHARVVGAADLAERAVALHQIVLGSSRSGGSLSRMDRQTPEGRAPGDRRHAVLKEMSAGECVGHGCSVLGTPRAHARPFVYRSVLREKITGWSDYAESL